MNQVVDKSFTNLFGALHRPKVAVIFWLDSQSMAALTPEQSTAKPWFRSGESGPRNPAKTFDTQKMDVLMQ